MAEGEVAAHGNVQIARLIFDWPFPCVEPRLLFFEIHSVMGKGRREIEYHCVSRVRCNDGSGVLVVICLVDRLDERLDIGIISRVLSSYGCGRHDVFSFALD